MSLELTEEQTLIQDTARRLVRKELEPVAAANDQEEKFAAEFLEHLSGLGLMGITTPESYGGSNAGTVALSLVLQEIAHACPATALVVSVTHLVAASLLAYGTKGQKDRFLRPVAAGQFLGAIAFTEPVGGSNPEILESISTKRGDQYFTVLNIVTYHLWSMGYCP